MSFDLKLHAYRLLMDEPFFAALSRKIEKKVDRSIPTAGVYVNKLNGQFEMIYNPEFLASLPEHQIKGVLKHEFYHLIFEHVTNRKPEGVPHKTWNIAADLAINSHLQGELPELACMPGVGPFEALPLGESAEWYLKNITDDQVDQCGEGDEGQPGEPGEGEPGTGQIGSHEGWDDEGQSPEEDAANQMAKERLKQAMKEAAQEASKSPNGWGSIGGDLKKEIIKRLETKVDWKKVMRYFIKTSQRANKSSTVRRINRRYAYIHPGKKVKRQAKIAIAICAKEYLCGVTVKFSEWENYRFQGPKNNNGTVDCGVTQINSGSTEYSCDELQNHKIAFEEQKRIIMIKVRGSASKAVWKKRIHHYNGSGPKARAYGQLIINWAK